MRDAFFGLKFLVVINYYAYSFKNGLSSGTRNSHVPTLLTPIVERISSASVVLSLKQRDNVRRLTQWPAESKHNAKSRAFLQTALRFSSF